MASDSALTCRAPLCRSADEEKREKREAAKKTADGFRALLDEIAEGGDLSADTTVSSLERSQWRDDPRLARYAALEPLL